MQGRTYHRIFPIDSTRHEHPAQWLLYDSSRRNAIAAKHNIPSSFVNAVRFDLEQRNMMYHVYQRFSELNLSQRMHTSSLLTLVLETKLPLCSISEMHRTPPLDRFISNVLLTLHRHQFLYLIPYTNQCNIHYYFHMRHQAGVHPQNHWVGHSAHLTSDLVDLALIYSTSESDNNTFLIL